MLSYRRPLAEALRRYCDDVLDCVRDAKKIDVEDVRRALHEDLRRLAEGA